MSFFATFVLILIPLIGCKKEQTIVKNPVEEIQPLKTEEKVETPVETKKIDEEIYAYVAKGRRDPFLPLTVSLKKKPTRKAGATPVESYDVDEIKLIAIAWDRHRHYALIMLPDNKSYTITEGMTLGLHGGKVHKITDEEVIIREYIKDSRGNVRSKNTVLRLLKGE